MKKNKINKELRIGIFTLIIFAGAYWGINFLRGVDVLSSNNDYYAYYDQSGNIEVSSPVLLRGIKIGTVTGVGIESVDAKVKVVLSVSKKFDIPVNSIAELTDKSLMGGKAIAIEIGDSKEILEGHGVLESRVNDELKNQIEDVKGMLDEVVTKLTTTLDNVNMLLTQENIESMTATLQSVSSLSSSLDHMVKVEQTKISNITTGLECVVSDFQSSMPALQSTLTNLDSITSSIKGSNLDQTLIAAGTAVASLNKTLDDINSGSGTIGLLINDPSLYNNLSGLLSDFKAHPKRYVHFSLFGRKDK